MHVENGYHRNVEVDLDKLGASTRHFQQIFSQNLNTQHRCTSSSGTPAWWTGSWENYRDRWKAFAHGRQDHCNTYGFNMKEEVWSGSSRPDWQGRIGWLMNENGGSCGCSSSDSGWYIGSDQGAWHNWKTHSSASGHIGSTSSNQWVMLLV
jgi:hypothetical protein